jgi:hypothetical protein
MPDVAVEGMRIAHRGRDGPLVDDRRVDPHLAAREHVEDLVSYGLGILCGVQNGVEVDALPGQTSPERLKPVAGLAATHRDGGKNEVQAGTRPAREVEVAGLVAEEIHSGHPLRTYRGMAGWALLDPEAEVVVARGTLPGGPAEGRGSAAGRGQAPARLAIPTPAPSV